MIDNNISRRTAYGAVWLIASRLGARVIDLFGVLILARFLTPNDFGLIAIAMSIIIIAEAIMEFPINQALVSIELINKAHFDTAFTIGLVRGLILGAFIIALSIPIAYAYNEPKIVAPLCILSLAPIARGLQSPALVIFNKAIDFRRDVIIEIGGKLLSLILTYVFILSYNNYWAIAINTVSTPIIMVVISYFLAPYKPKISLDRWVEFVDFFGWNTAAQVVGSLSWQSDRLILGAFVEPQAMGSYSIANDLAALPEQSIVKPLMRPLLSAFVYIKENPARLAVAYLEASSIVFAIGVPIILTISILAKPLVFLALGGKWASSVPIMQWLALSLIPPLIYAPLFPLAIAVGKVQIFFTRSLAELAFKAPVVLLGAWSHGIYGVIVARITTSLFMLVVSGLLVKELLSLSLFDQVKGLFRTMLSGTILTFVLYGIRDFVIFDDQLKLALGLVLVITVGITVFILAHVVLWILEGRPQGPEQRAVSMVSVLLSRWA